MEARVLDIFPSLDICTFDFGRGLADQTGLVNESVFGSVVFGSDCLEQGFLGSQDLHSGGRVSIIYL